MLVTVKLIAEPWDAGPDGYQLGQVPGRLVGVERRLPGLRPAVLAGRRRPGPRARLPADRVARDLRPERPAHLRQHQLRHLPRRLHPDRPRELRPQAQRGQRRRQPRRDRRELQPQLGGRGADRLGADPAGPRPHEAQPPHDPDALPGRADAARGRRDRPDPVRQQQRLLPGQRDQLARLGRGRDRPRLHQLRARPHRHDARANPILRRRNFFTGEPVAGRQDQGRDLDPARRQGDDRGRVVRHREPRASGCCCSAGPPTRSTRWAAPSAATPCSCS